MSQFLTKSQNVEFGLPLKAENWLLFTIFQAKKEFSGAETHMRVFNFLSRVRSSVFVKVEGNIKIINNWRFWYPFWPLSWELLGQCS